MKNQNNPTKKRHPITWIPSVYFAMGLPFMALSIVSVYMFADLGIGEAKIAFWTSLLILPYSLKPIWSPLMELYRTKKEFVVVTEMLSGICFGLIAFMLPVSYFFSFSIALFAVAAFSGATHDIATDGIYLTALDKKTQAKFIGWQGAFFNLAKVLANSGMVWLAGKLIVYFQHTNPEKANTYAWMVIMAILAGLLIFLSIYHWFVLPTGSKSEDSADNFSEAMRALGTVFKDFFQKKYILYYIIFIVGFRLAEGLAIKMLPLFLKADVVNGGLGLDNEEIGAIYGIAILAFIIGSILGGNFIAARGLKRSLFQLVVIFNVPFVIYFLLALYQPDNLWIIGSGLVFEYFCYGFGFVGLTLFMMQQVAPGKHTMAHYAFASGIMNLGFMLTGMVSGWIYEQVGYQTFFLIVLIVTVPAFLLAWFVPFTYDDSKKAKEVV